MYLKRFTELSSNLCLSSLSLFITSLFLLAVREEVFRAWLRFAYWWIPISVLLVLIASDSSGGLGMPVFLSKEIIAIWLSIFFFLISLIIIGVKSWKLRGKSERN